MFEPDHSCAKKLLYVRSWVHYSQKEKIPNNHCKDRKVKIVPTIIAGGDKNKHLVTAFLLKFSFFFRVFYRYLLLQEQLVLQSKAWKHCLAPPNQTPSEEMEYFTCSSKQMPLLLIKGFPSNILKVTELFYL